MGKLSVSIKVEFIKKLIVAPAWVKKDAKLEMALNSEFGEKVEIKYSENLTDKMIVDFWYELHIDGKLGSAQCHTQEFNIGDLL